MTKTKRERTREAWRETLRRLADKLPDPELPPPQEEEDEDDTHRGASTPPPIPEN